MKLSISVKPNSSQERIERISDREYKIWLKEPADNNKANTRLVNLLAKHLNTPYKKIKIKNLTSRNKIVEIL